MICYLLLLIFFSTSFLWAKKTPFVSLRWVHHYEQEVKMREKAHEEKLKKQEELFLREQAEKERIANVRLSQRQVSQKASAVSSPQKFSPRRYQRSNSPAIIEHVTTLPKEFKLNGVMYSPDGSSAIIDNRVYKEGADLSLGVVLVEVRKREVILEYKNQKFVLSSATNEVVLYSGE